MKLIDHPGFKRLLVLITLASFVITWILLIVNERHVSDQEAFAEFPIIAGLIALITFVFVRIKYWVVEGFRKEE